MSHLERNLLALEPDTRWVTDVTKIPTQEGRRSLYVVLDLFRELIVGWFMHHRRQDRAMVIRAVEIAVWQRHGEALSYCIQTEAVSSPAETIRDISVAIAL
jgi:putative transposase